MYPVIKPFYDKQDDKREYRLNDWYPRFNFDVSEERIEQLKDGGYIKGASTVEGKEKFPKHIGGGWYELANGERVQGKENAEKQGD